MPAIDSTSPSAAQALIATAIELFGRAGFEAVGTRALCEQAGANLAAIRYHFGSKDGLYRAAVQHVVDQLAPRLAFALAAFDQGRRLAGNDRARQALLISTVVERVLEMFLLNPEAKRIMPFVLREFFVPSQHFPLFYEALPRRLHELATEIVAMTQGLDPTSEQAMIRAHALIGQMMAFNIGREILFRRTGWTDYTPARAAAITAEVRVMVLQSLQLAPHPEVASHDDT